MTQRETEDLILKLDEAFENGSGDRVRLALGGNECGPALVPKGGSGFFLRRDVMEAAEKIKADRRRADVQHREALALCGSNGHLSDYGVPS